jgi:hypothetical protein
MRVLRSEARIREAPEETFGLSGAKALSYGKAVIAVAKALLHPTHSFSATCETPSRQPARTPALQVES